MVTTNERPSTPKSPQAKFPRLPAAGISRAEPSLVHKRAAPVLRFTPASQPPSLEKVRLVGPAHALSVLAKAKGVGPRHRTRRAKRRTSGLSARSRLAESVGQRGTGIPFQLELTQCEQLLRLGAPGCSDGIRARAFASSPQHAHGCSHDERGNDDSRDGETALAPAAQRPCRHSAGERVLARRELSRIALTPELVLRNDVPVHRRSSGLPRSSHSRTACRN